MIDISVIIINRNTRELLRAALRSVCESPVSTEVIVVDNASTDGSAEMMRKEFPAVRLIVNENNEGFAKPNNDAVRIAGGRYYFLLNSDARVCDKALERLVKFMDQNPAVGVCGPQLLNPDGTIQPSCRGFITLWTHFCDMLILDRIFPRSRIFASSVMTYFDHQMQREVDHIMAAAIVVRPEAVRNIGLFDERLSIHYNDIDFSHRMKEHGWKTVFYPEAQVVHHLGETTRRHNVRFELFDELYSNFFYYVRKHYGAATLLFFKLLMVIGFTPRVIYWFSRRLFSGNEKVREMAQFSLKSLLLGLTVWKLR